MKSIVVVGSINIDLCTRTEFTPKLGETVFGQNFDILQGGKGANQAVAASRLGANVNFIGAVGNDSNGELALNNLKNEGINIDGVEIIEGIPTGVANVIMCKEDNSIIVVGGANDKVDASFINKKRHIIEAADIVLVQNEIPSEGVRATLEIAHNSKKVIIYNPAPLTEETYELSKYATYCTPNEHESKGFKTKSNLVITLGERGVAYAGAIIPARKVVVVDTTGAGDTFNGAFCCALAQEKTVVEAIKYGIKASAYTIQSIGAQTGMPYKRTLINMQESV